MKDWIKELCPEIAEWQAELIAKEAKRGVEAEREACAAMVERGMGDWRLGKKVAEAIRARGKQ